MQVILKLTTACNLNCVYCSEGNTAPQTLPPQIFYKLVDDLPPLLDSLNSKDAEFLFHGGEPMLYGRAGLLQLIDYAKNNLPNYNLKFLMQTNGTLIDDAWIDFFNAHNISVGISLDGYPELHDLNRRTKYNQPTAELILANLQKMRSHNLNAGTLMVLNSPRIDADNLFDFIKTYDLQPKIHSVIPCGRAINRHDTAEIFSAYIELLKKILARSLNESPPYLIDPLDDIFDAILGVANIRECSFNGTCGVNFISVYPNGEVSFCGRTQALTFGNLREENLLNLYNSPNAKKIRARQNFLQNNDCKNCADWKLCHGGCPFEAFNSAGTLNSKYPHCEQRKQFLAWLRSDGLKLLKQAFIREKSYRRQQLQLKLQLVRELQND